MRRGRLGALGALCAVVLAGATAGVAPAGSSASATASLAPVAESPTAIACGGSLNAQVTVSAQSGTTGANTAVMLVLDLSGSIGDGTKLANLRSAATDLSLIHI